MRQIASSRVPHLLITLLALVPASAFATEAADQQDEGPPVESSADQPASEGGGSGVLTPSLSESAEGFELEAFGYLRSSLSYIDYDAQESEFIGRNHGFGLASVRFGVEGKRDRLRFVVSADGAVAAVQATNTASGKLTFRLADAFAGYELMPGLLEVRLGQQEAPFDREGLLSSGELPFISRSVWQRGVRGVEGFNVDGMGIDREVGLGLAGERIPLGSGSVALSYTAAVTNGTPPGEAFNENRSLAAYLRVEGHFADLLTVGGAVYQNMRTYGELPDLLDERNIGFTADVSADFKGAWLRLDFAQRQMDYPDVAVEPTTTALGGGASIGYRTPCGFEGAYRIAFYDPTWKYSSAGSSLADQLEANDLLHHTFGVNWVPADQPFALQLNYTLAQENELRAVRNDRLELLGRLVF